MIFEKRGMWKISGRPEKYSSLAEAEAALGILKQGEIKAAEIEKAKEEKVQADAILANEERLARLKALADDSTPYEKMIAKNVCKICNLEPCECFTYTQKTEVGE